MQSMVDFAQNTICRCSLFVIISDPSFHYVDMIPGEWDLFLSAHDDKKNKVMSNKNCQYS